MSARDFPTGRQVVFLRILGRRIAEQIWNTPDPFHNWQEGSVFKRGDASELIEILQAISDRFYLVEKPGSKSEEKTEPEPEPEPEPDPMAWAMEREPVVPKGKHYIKVYRKFYHPLKLAPDYQMSNGSRMVERQPGWVWECHHPMHRSRSKNARKDGIVRGRAQEGRVKTTNNALQHWVKYHLGD